MGKRGEPVQESTSQAEGSLRSPGLLCIVLMLRYSLQLRGVQPVTVDFDPIC